ncbi:MAG TPA: S8 family serine peptidase, partial [Actinomycetota bacterium]|nr:S8 family serine peptidase [Actinomycetota bacterium]
MNIAFGVTWNDAKKGPKRAAAMALAAAMIATLIPRSDAAATAQSLVSVIVRALPGAEQAAEDAVTSSGGRVGRSIGIIDGFVADVPAGELARLSRIGGVASVSPNVPVTLTHAVDGYDASTDGHSMWTIATVTKATTMYSEGFTGRGVDVAVIDSGVVPVNGLTASGKVLNGPDLSFESRSDSIRYLDTYGHGTHMAGIIAGRDNAVTYRGRWWTNHDDFTGMAPDARIVNVKVANAQGTTDVSQILAAIDWVVQNRARNGLNIRVLNLSFGTDSVQSWVLDPLSYAVDVAWRKGVFVVAAAGNNGNALGSLSNPAYNPRVMAVGAADANGTFSIHDDTIPPWSSRGDGIR